MRKRRYSWVRTLALTACAVLFLAASCEQKKSSPEPKAESANATEDAAAAPDADNEPTAAHGVFDEKTPETVGPKAPAIFMLSALKGYTEPCGCTLDVMLGGIDRIAGYVESARELYPSVQFADGGDLFFETKTIAEHELPQERARVELIAQAIAKMDLTVTVPGEKDFALGRAEYRKLLEQANVEAIAANLDVDGMKLPPTKRIPGEMSVVYVGVVDPSLYDGIDGVTPTDPAAALGDDEVVGALASADVAVLLVHGEVPFAKKMLEAAPGADFALVGHGPRETDQVDRAGDGHTLEPYDQGRYLGILKLFNAGAATGRTFTNARSGSEAELEKIGRQIEHVNESINRLPPATPGEEPKMLLTLRKRLERLEARRNEIKNASIEVPADAPAFLWRTVAMEPGYEPDPEIARARAEYNARLRELNDVDREVPPTPAGTPAYIGSNQCATCHAPADEFWKETAHADAIATLQKRNKAFDQKCIGCHVVGYEKPGGSVLGKLEYDAEVPLADGGNIEVHKDLRNVGCESCHGPGSFHRSAPLDADGKPQHITVDPGPAECKQCHVPDHSPRFDFDIYVKQITGEGHPRR